MTITIAQHTGSDALGNPVQNPTISYALAQTAGNLNVVIVGWTGAVTISSVTDSQGNSYSQLGSASGGTTIGTVAIWYCLSIGGHAAGNVVTIHFSANATNPEAWLIEANTTTGTWSAGPFDHGTDGGTSGTAMTCAGVNITSQPTLGVASGFSGNGETVNAGTGWTALDALSASDQDQWKSISATGTQTATASQTPNPAAWAMCAGYFYTAASSAGLEEEGGYRATPFERAIPILAAAPEEIVLPLKVEEYTLPWYAAPNLPAPLLVPYDDPLVTPLLIDDVGVPLPPLFGDGLTLLASAEEPNVQPLLIDDVGVPLPPLFDPGQYLLASPEEPNVQPLPVDDVGVPLPPLFGDGLAIMATAEEPKVSPLGVDDTSVIPQVWWIDTPYRLASGDEWIASVAVALQVDDVGAYLPPIVSDWISVTATAEEAIVKPLGVDDTSIIVPIWDVSTSVILASGDESLSASTPAALEETAPNPSACIADTLAVSFSWDEPVAYPPIDESPIVLPVWPVNPLPILAPSDDLPLAPALDESASLPLPLPPHPVSPLWSPPVDEPLPAPPSPVSLEEPPPSLGWPHSATWLSVLVPYDEAAVLALVPVLLGPSYPLVPVLVSVSLVPVLGPSSPIRPVVGPGSSDPHA